MNPILFVPLSDGNGAWRPTEKGIDRVDTIWFIYWLQSWRLSYFEIMIYDWHLLYWLIKNYKYILSGKQMKVTFWELWTLLRNKSIILFSGRSIGLLSKVWS
jgi:hypothetical protein